MGQFCSREVLKFYTACGVDETHGDEPYCRSVSGPGPVHVKPVAPLQVGNAEAEASRIAAGCTSVAELQDAIRSFGLCPLSKFATHPMVGFGVSSPKLLIITEMPEAAEDAGGVPLSGPYGELLRRIMPALGRSFEQDAFVFPSIFWRSAGGVVPDRAMVFMLRPFVRRFVELLAPGMILVLGSAPLLMLFGRDEPMSVAHGRWLKLDGTLVMPTFSLASMMGDAGLKKAAWGDMQVMLDPPEPSNLKLHI